MSLVGLPGRSAFADQGHLRRLVPGINPPVAVPRDETQAPAIPVDVIRHATVDAGSIPAASTKRPRRAVRRGRRSSTRIAALSADRKGPNFVLALDLNL